MKNRLLILALLALPALLVAQVPQNVQKLSGNLTAGFHVPNGVTIDATGTGVIHATLADAAPASGITGTLGVDHGGTGATSLTATAILLGAGTSPISASDLTYSTPTLTVPDAFGLTSAGSIALTAGGSNKSITLTPSGTGSVNVGPYTTGNPITTQTLTLGNSAAATTAVLLNYGNENFIRGYTAGGTFASPSATATNKALLSLNGGGYVDGAFTGTKAALVLQSNEAWVTGSNGTRINFNTTANGDTVLRDYMALVGGTLSVGRYSHTQPGVIAATGATFQIGNYTLTDSTSSGTIAVGSTASIGQTTFAASSATTVTNAASLYIAGDVAQGTNVTLLNSYGLWNVGKTRTDGAVYLNLNSSPGTAWFAGPLITGADATNTSVQVDAYGAQARYDVRRANGTKASPTTLTNGDIMGGVFGRGYNGAAYSGTAVGMQFSSTETWTNSAGTSTAIGTKIDFFTVPAGQTSSVTALTFGSGNIATIGNTSTWPAWTTSGVALNSKAATYTDSSSSGTVATAVANSFAVPTFAASASTTFTNAATVYIAGDVAAGTNVTLTNSYGLWNVGKTRLDGNVTMGGTLTKLGGAYLLQTSSALTDGAGASVATFTNSPVAGNPTKWIAINDNGTARYIPAF